MRAIWGIFGFGAIVTLFTRRRRRGSDDAEDGDSNTVTREDRPKIPALGKGWLARVWENESRWRDSDVYQPPRSLSTPAVPPRHLTYSYPPLWKRFGSLIVQRATESVGGGTVSVATCPLFGFHYRLKRFPFHTPENLEVRIATTIAPGSPFLLHAVGCWLSRSMDYCLLSRLSLGGTLASYFPIGIAHPISTVRFLGAQILSGLEYLHALDLAHRDLTLENVLVGLDGYIHIGDFGHAVKCGIFNYPQHADACPRYAAPELAAGRKGAKPADVWALGVALYRMLCGFFPFNDLALNPRATTQKAVYTTWLSRMALREARPVLVDMFFQIFRVEPTDRITLVELRDHPFFNGCNWTDLAEKTLESPLLSKVWENRVPLEPPEELFLEDRARVGLVKEVAFAAAEGH